MKQKQQISSKLFLIIMLFFAFTGLEVAMANPALIFRTNKATGESIDMILRVKNTAIVSIDWGDGILVDYNVSSSNTNIVNGLKGSFVKVYSDNLIYFSCKGAGIIDLNISEALSLQQIYCDNNELKSLDVSCNSELSRLSLVNNKLTELDLTQNSKLTGLYLQNNQLDAYALNRIYVDLPNRTLSTGIYNVRNTGNPGVEASNTNILKNKNWIPDIEGNASFTYNVILNTNKTVGSEMSLKLRAKNAGNVCIDWGNGILSAYNIESDSVISYSGILKGSNIFIYNSELNYFECKSAGITTVDVFNSPGLIHLYLDNNELTELDISKNTLLNNLSLSNNKLTHLNIAGKQLLNNLSIQNNLLEACALDSIYNTLPINSNSSSTLYNIRNQENPGSLTSNTNTAIKKGWKVSIVGDSSGCSDALKVAADKDLFVKRSFVNGAVLFTNRTYVLENVPDSLSGYEFLANAASTKEEGLIMPLKDEFIYGITGSGALTDWTLLNNTELNYSDASKTKLAIYQKKVVKGQNIDLPQIDGFIGFTLLAKDINYVTLEPEKDARLSAIIIDSKPIVNFNKKELTYTVYLPFSYKGIPTIEPILNEDVASYYTISPINIDGSEAERTAKLVVTSQDGTNTQTYSVCFEKLPEMDLYLCIGQSNMAGAAPLESDKGDLEILNNAFLFNSSDRFEKAKNGMNRYSNVLSTTAQYYGLTYSFAKTLSAQTGKPIGLIVNARGGSSIQLWEKEGTDAGDTLYVKTLERAVEAKKWGNYKGILWHQGEANSTNFSSINYMSLLTKMVANIRLDLGDESLFFVAGEIGRWNSINVPFNAMINTIESFVPNSACVSSEGLVNVTNLTDDNEHFNRDGLIALGERYAKVVLDSVITTGIINKFNDDVRIFAYRENLQIILPINTKAVLCKIFDINGQKLKQEIINNDVTYCLKDGVYLVSVYYDNKYVYKKIMIKS